MKARVTALPTRTLVLMAAGAVLVYALAVWFLLVAPKRADATGLKEDVAAAELRLVAEQATANRPQASAPVELGAGDVLRLAKAMPSSADQPGLVLELDRLAVSTGLKLRSITPREPVLTPGTPTAIPVVVTGEGTYRQITRFVRRARELVRFSGGNVRATGRLFTVQGVDLAESTAKKFPFLDATITLNAFVYDGPIVVETPAPAVTEEDDETSGATSAAGGTP